MLWRRGLKRTLVRTVIGLVIGFSALLLLTTRPGDRSIYPPATDGIEVLVLDNGFHSDLVIATPHLIEAARLAAAPRASQALARFAHYDHVMLGWGDLEFYANPTEFSWRWAGVAARAAFGANGPTAVHIAALRGDPRVRFPHDRMVRLHVSEEGLVRLVGRLETSISKSAPLRPGVYGDASAFFPSATQFHIFRVCNHWSADLLDAAGVPTQALLAGLPDAFIADLIWRGGGEIVSAPGA